jgi:hypothetical protein
MPDYVSHGDKAILDGASADHQCRVTAAWAQLHQVAHDRLGESEVPSRFTGELGRKLLEALEATPADASAKDMVAAGESFLFPAKDEPAPVKAEPESHEGDAP